MLTLFFAVNLVFAYPQGQPLPGQGVYPQGQPLPGQGGPAAFQGTKSLQQQQTPTPQEIIPLINDLVAKLPYERQKGLYAVLVKLQTSPQGGPQGGNKGPQNRSLSQQQKLLGGNGQGGNGQSYPGTVVPNQFNGNPVLDPSQTKIQATLPQTQAAPLPQTQLAPA
jgi:hypothetical protein